MNPGSPADSPAAQSTRFGTPASQPSTFNSQPPSIPDHELLHDIGRGSYGEVWLARNKLGTHRAVKIVYRSTFEDSRPFEREFKGIQKFEPISRSHEGLVDILQVGGTEAYFYYVMELADGEEMQNEKCKMQNEAVANPTASDHQKSILNSECYILNYRPKTLRSLIRPNPQPSTLPSSVAALRRVDNPQPTPARLPVAECVQIGSQIASALACLHQHGLVHRDVKPSNIIFVNGVPKLADIGLVADVSEARSYVGTEGFIPPEGPGTPQADLYSLGKVLYEISTGKDRRDFPELPEEFSARQNDNRSQDSSAIEPGSDQGNEAHESKAESRKQKAEIDQAAFLELNAIVVKACNADPRARYQSAEEMRDDLALLQRGQSVKRKRVLHHWQAVSKKVGVAVSLLAVVVAGVVVLRQHPSDPYLHSAIPGVDKLVEQGNSVLQARSAERIRTALGYYNEAIQLDPNFVPAQFGVFMTLVHRGADQRGAPEELRREHRTVAKKLMEMNSNLAESRAASAMLKWIDWQFPEALAEAHLATQKRAASKEGKAAAHNGYGYFLLESGRPDEALEQYQLAEEKSPSGAMMQHHLGLPYFVKRDFAQALKHYRESLRLAPAQGTAHYQIGKVYEEQTNLVAAIQEYEERERLDGGYNAERKAFYDELREAVRRGGAEGYWRKRLDLALGESQPDLYYIATLYARLGEKENAYAWLRRACDKKAFTEGLMVDLCWDHNDEQFKAIARGIRLLQ